jgi:hypothetical protein
MYPLNLGASFVVQQQLSGGAVFTGVEFGRSALTIGAGNAALTVRTKKYGAFGPYTLQVITGTGVTATTVTVTGFDIVVRPVLAATSAQVAATINATALCPILAKAGGDGTGTLLVAAAAPLTGGLDPSGSADQYKWVRTGAGNDGGLFQFENDAPNTVMLVRQAEFVFPGLGADTSLVASIVDLDDALVEISGSAVAFVRATVNAALPDFFVSDINMLLGPRQAIKVVCPAAGLVRLTVRREARYPYQ